MTQSLQLRVQTCMNADQLFDKHGMQEKMNQVEQIAQQANLSTIFEYTRLSTGSIVYIGSENDLQELQKKMKEAGFATGISHPGGTQGAKS